MEIKKLQGMKPAIIYCIINRLSSQQFGPLIEKYFIYKYKYKRNPASKCIGDCSKAGENYEVKVSLGGAQHKRFNYIQIRICHDIMQYVLVAYHLTYENVDAGGELYIFKLSKLEMKEVLIQYGGYAHGTKKRTWCNYYGIT